MKVIDDFKMLRKGDKVRRYVDSLSEKFEDYLVLQGGFADRDCLIYCRCIRSGRPEFINVNDLYKLIDE